MTAKSSAARASRKARAIEMAAQYVPYRIIADELGCTRQTVYNYIRAYLSELPPVGFLTRHRLHVAIAEADSIDTLLRIASVARHYAHPDADGDAIDFALPDLATVQGRLDAVNEIGRAVATGALTPAQATALLACVKEASDLDDLSAEFRRIDTLEMAFAS